MDSFGSDIPCVSCAPCGGGSQPADSCVQTCQATVCDATCAAPTRGLTYCMDTCEGHVCGSFGSEYAAIC